ncbi:prepilin peptidase [Isoptericola croceus]|uniref:prepilin peptidase n=1 Tax=Isoptericola croceus TaxID=3031406 RepID=UPI0023F86D6B|nr:A24 family peptidase [Isoptericola croceus]
MSLAQRARDELSPVRRAVLLGALPAVVWAAWVSGPGWAAPALAVAGVSGVALFAIDLGTHRLPNALTYPTTAVVAVLLVGAGALDGDWDAVSRSLLGALALGVGYLMLHLINPSGLGFGDVKLAVLLGMVTAWFGWPVLWATMLLPFLLGGLVAAVLLITRRADRKTAIAFGPYMLLGALVALSAGRIIAVA